MIALRLRPEHRSSLLFVAGLLLAAALAVGLDGRWKARSMPWLAELDLSARAPLSPMQPRPLSGDDLAAAEQAWRYIAKQTQPETGLVNSVADFPSTTLWDQGSYLLALVAARRLGLVSDTEFHTRATRLLDAFDRLPLFDGRLPNKAYDTRSLAMVDYTNTPVAQGIGWSALDIARMLLAFRTLERLYPDYGMRVRSLLSRWDLSAMAVEGQLWGGLPDGNAVALRQEGRLGYEQYAGRAAVLWGLDAIQSASARRALAWQDIYGVEVPVDTRRAATYGAITPILSEPFLLQAIELGLDSEGRVLADRVYRAQVARHRQTGHLTAVSEDHINQAPYFLYNSVFSNQKPWAVITEDGSLHPELRTLSVKAAFAWDALYDTAYTDQLRAAVTAIGASDQGWPAGIYEADGAVNDVYTLNTNAVVIEAMHYVAYGPLWQVR